MILQRLEEEKEWENTNLLKKMNSEKFKKSNRGKPWKKKYKGKYKGESNSPRKEETPTWIVPKGKG